jgi:hypothetical protein
MKSLREREKPKRNDENERDEGDGGSLILFNEKGYYTIPVLPLTQFS